MTVRAASAAAAIAIAACGHPPAPQHGERAAGQSAPQPRDATRGGGNGPAQPDQGGRERPPSIDPGSPTSPVRLAAIQKAMNELDEAAQQCWAAAATERFDIEGELALQIDIAAGRSHAAVVRDTVHHPGLAACVVELLAGYPWAPPLHGQSIQLPFKFRAPDGQSTIDRALVPWNGQGHVSVAVLLDENNTGNADGSMVELAIAPGGTTGMRWADRAELWYFLGAGEVRAVAGAPWRVAAGDMMYAPRGAAREVAAPAAGLHAMIVIVPGGREGAARGGALPTREVTAVRAAPASPIDPTGEAPRPAGRAVGVPTPRDPASPIVLPASGAKTYGRATIFADAGTIHDQALAASIVALPAGATIAEHVHAGETELLYVLAGGGTMTVGGVALPVTATSVVQIPRHTRHAFTAASDVRAVQIYTPAGPEQRFKAHP